MKVKKMDYSSAWDNYLNESSNFEPPKEYPYEACFRKAAKKYDLPLTMLIALARGESDFNPRAKSTASCYGIMQIQWPGTAKDLGFNSIDELYNPCKNIMGGARYIKMMLKRYDGDLHLALAAYNYGPGKISKGVMSIPKGANWYSGYIYHHLQRVLTHAKPGKTPIKSRVKYKPGSKIPVILFHNPYRARDFLVYFKDRAPDLRLDWFRTTLGETYVVLVFDTEKEKINSVKRMETLGYYLDLKKQFQ